MSRQVCFVSAVVILVGSFTAFAQQNAQTNRDQSDNLSQAGQSANRQSHGHSQPAWKSKDHCFATSVALGNQEEIAISDVGKQKALNADVKMFAEMMIRDHHAFLEKLQKFAPEACKAGCLRESNGKQVTSTQNANAKSTAGNDAREVPNAKATENAAATTQNEVRNRDSSTSSTASGDRKSELYEVELELARQCLKSATEMLNEKSGVEFDKCFMGLQIAKHMGMKDKLMVYQRHVTGELSEVMAEGLQTTEEHLKKAEKLMKSLDRGEGSEKSAKSDTNTSKNKDEK